MSILTIDTKSMTDTKVLVGSEGAISICDGNSGIIRILTAEQARDFASALELAAQHAEGRLVGSGV